MNKNNCYMKNLFTLCACAFFSFTLSAQSEQAAGSFYLGTGNALDLVNIFGGDINMAATIGYAVIDDLVISGSINSNEYGNASCATDQEINLDLGVRYFWNGIFFQAGATNLLSAGPMDTGEMSISLGVGKYFQLNALNDRFYIDPQINYNLDDGFETMIGLGLRF
jgi:hypothetical protein